MWQAVKLRDGKLTWWASFRTESEALAAVGLPAVVGNYALDGDVVGGKKRDRAVQGPDRGAGLLVVEHLGVGQAAVVVDRDVQVFAADGLAANARRVGLLKRSARANDR